MIRIGLRDAKAHFHRLVMSIIAIALGVSFVVGSFCFRSMLNDQVTQLMGTNSDHDVYVRGTTEEQNDSSFATSGPISSGTSYNKIDTSLVTQIEQVKGIDNVSPPERTIGATLLDHDGNAGHHRRANAHDQRIIRTPLARRQFHRRHLCHRRA